MRWDVLGGLAFGATVTFLGWLLLRHPLTAATTSLRQQRKLQSIFGESQRPIHAAPDTSHMAPRP